jgi:signal transduction histidine kinase
MFMQRPNPLLSYSVAVISVGLASMAAVMMDRLDPDPSPMFVIAVLCSAWYGGLGPGLAATALASLSATILFIEPPHSPGFGVEDAVRLGVFFIVALLVSYLQAGTRRSMGELQAAKDAAEAANRAKDHFLAILSHELRTPLTPALGSVSVLETDESIPRFARDELALIRRNIELEARLIDDLLDIARLNRGKLTMHLELLDAHGALRDAVRICQEEARTKRLSVDVTLGATTSYVCADAARLRQIFWNLLRNAIKFTPVGGQITVRSSNDIDGRLVVEVRDNGIGMDQQALQRIFRPFEQGDPTIESRFGGMGLGLAISKELVTLLKGELSAQSQGKDRGATFEVRLPVVQTPSPAAPDMAGQPQPARDPHRHLRLLLVEDHEDTLKLMSRLLNRAGYQVTPARSVQTALDSAAREPFDLVISDLGLPDGSGHELMRQLTLQYHRPGIALSGFGSAEDVATSHRAGFSRHLIKPVDFRRLQGAIEEVACAAEE